MGAPRLANEARTIVVVAPQAALGPGRYVVRWQIAGADGHPTRGSFVFVVMEGDEGARATDGARRAETLPARSPASTSWATPDEGSGVAGQVSREPATRQASESPGATSGERPSFDARSPLYAIVRWVQYVAAFLVLGAFVFTALVVDRVRVPEVRARVYLAATRRRALQVARGSAIILLLAQGARLLAQWASLRGNADASFDVSITDVVVGTSWGAGWMLVVVGAVLAMMAIQRAEGEADSRQQISDGLALVEPANTIASENDAATTRAGAVFWFAGSALTLAVGLALSGHQAASPLGMLGVAVDVVHVLGTGGWIGTLGVLVLAGLAWPHTHSTSHEGVAELLRTFSPVVLVAAALGGGAGLVLAFVNVGSFAALWGAAYGRVLLLKLGVLSLVVGTGAYNWRRVVPLLGSEQATRALRRSASVEAVIAVLVVAITSVLVAIPMK